MLLRRPEDKITDALELLGRYGGIDGDHHKAWVLDQIARILIGDLDAYNAWVVDMKNGLDGPDTYGYDEGIAP
jgi:hypothetical protein